MSNRMSVPEMHAAIDNMNAELVALSKSFLKANARLERAVAKAQSKELQRLSPTEPSGTSEDPKQDAISFPARKRSAPTPVSAENPEPIGYLALDGSAFNVVSYTYGLDASDAVGRQFGWPCYLSVRLRTEAGDSLIAQLADKDAPHGVALETGDIQLRGISVRAAMTNKTSGGHVAVVFVGNAGSLKVA